MTVTTVEPTSKLYCSECKRWILDVYGHIEGYAVAKCKACGEKRLLVPGIDNQLERV